MKHGGLPPISWRRGQGTTGFVEKSTIGPRLGGEAAVTVIQKEHIHFSVFTEHSVGSDEHAVAVFGAKGFLAIDQKHLQTGAADCGRAIIGDIEVEVAIAVDIGEGEGHTGALKIEHLR